MFRNTLKFFSITTFLFLLIGCNLSTKDSEIEPNEEGETVRKEYTGELPELSIYNLPSTWENQEGEEIHLEDLRGKNVVLTMIYTTCKASCPRLVADVRHIQQDVSDAVNKETLYVFVSIDPETDTPEQLKKFAIDNKMDNNQWLFLRGDEEDTRTFAAVLAVNYKRISPLDFSHSNIISVFDKNGVLHYQKEGLADDNRDVVGAIEEL